MNCIVQHWAFGERPSGCQFQAVNCHYCGNYKFVSTVELFNLISNNAKCICSPEPFDIFEDDDGSMGEMWEPDTPSVQYTDYDYDSDF